MNNTGRKLLLFSAAVLSIYLGGFFYDELGPFFYTVTLALIASVPHLIKFTFWKKVLLLLPMILLRVLVKIVLAVFGKSAVPKILARYASLELWARQTLQSFQTTKGNVINRWQRTSQQARAYLLLIFLPFSVVIFFVLIIIEILRLKFVQFLIEKLLQIVFVSVGKKLDLSKVGQTLSTNPYTVKTCERLPFLKVFLQADNNDVKAGLASTLIRREDKPAGDGTATCDKPNSD